MSISPADRRSSMHSYIHNTQHMYMCMSVYRDDVCLTIDTKYGYSFLLRFLDHGSIVNRIKSFSSRTKECYAVK